MDEDLGQATVVYENSEQDGDPIERTLENENVVYFQDHWLLKIDERDGEDVVRRIPAQRVYYVERTVEEFEFLCKECHSDLCHQPRGDLERVLVESGAGEDDRESFLGRYTDLVTGEDEPAESER